MASRSKFRVAVRALLKTRRRIRRLAVSHGDFGTVYLVMNSFGDGSDQ